MSIDTDYAVLRSVLTGKPVEGVRTPNVAPDPHGGWAVEFGVYSGYSLSLIAAHMPVIGFDSFKGLPEDWREGFPKGSFAIPEDGPSVQDILLMGPQRMVVAGWFEDTVPTFPFPHLSLVHVDCDLYSSTVEVLRAVTPHVGPGTIFVFDEFDNYPGWEEHEAKAWSEWCVRHNANVSLIAEHDQEKAFVLDWWGS